MHSGRMLIIPGIVFPIAFVIYVAKITEQYFIII